MAELATGFDCRVCGRHHDALPLSFSVRAPAAALLIPADELDRRVVLSPEQCVIDGRSFFLRGRVVVPIAGLDEPFIWGVWAEIGPKDFLRTQSFWKVKGRERTPPYRGWLNTDLPLFGSTIHLEVRVRTQEVGRRPHFEVMSPEHPLGREQSAGITLERVQQIAERLLHSPPPSAI